MVESVKKIFLAQHFVSKLLIPVRYVSRLLLEIDKDSDVYILEINSNKYQVLKVVSPYCLAQQADSQPAYQLILYQELSAVSSQ